MSAKSKTSQASLSPEQLRKIVEKHLPGWLRACAADADASDGVVDIARRSITILL
jgi:hypothetical protein